MSIDTFIHAPSQLRTHEHQRPYASRPKSSIPESLGTAAGILHPESHSWCPQLVQRLSLPNTECLVLYNQNSVLRVAFFPCQDQILLDYPRL